MFKIIFAMLYLVVCIRSELIREGRIFNGNEANIEDHPWQAEINTKEVIWGIPFHDSHCGGVIIGTKWILSSAHCFKNKTLHYIVRVGSSKTVGFWGSSVYDIKNVTMHPKYVQEPPKNDIAIIELADYIEYDDNKRAIKMVNDTFTVDTNQTVQTSGYGRLCDSICENSERLLEISLSVISFDECRKAWPAITNQTICATNEISTTCRGDSGGPLTMKDDKNEPILIGVTRGGFLCNVTDPVVFSFIPSYREFIKSITGI